MYFTPISGDVIRMNFYTDTGCVLERVIEEHFYRIYSQISPNIVGKKEYIAGYPTDGIIRLYDDNDNYLGYLMQEVKRDVGLNSVQVHRSFLQTIMYLGNVFYDAHILGVDNFVGVILNSARYYCFIPKHVMVEVMENFEPHWKKYYRCAPSEAYKADNHYLDGWAKQKWSEIEKYCYNLDNTFKLDEFFETIYTKYLNYGINNGTNDAREGDSHQG